MKTTLIAACGLITSMLTALLITVIERLTGYNFFTLSIWLVVPAGALMSGVAAASGYYFGSLYFHTRPTKLLLIQMVAIAALTQVSIYYFEYSTLVAEDDGTRVSDVVPFKDYLDISLTTAHYRFGRGAGVDTGEVGRLG